MAYDFQKLADVELLEQVPDGASAFVAVDGTVKRVCLVLGLEAVALQRQFFGLPAKAMLPRRQ